MPHDNEWLKIVASTCLGLIAGLVAEPIKNSLSSRRTIREISRAIRVDLKFVSAAVLLMRSQDIDVRQVRRVLELPAFEHYWSVSKNTFYASSYLRELCFQCENILFYAQKMGEERCTKEEGLSSIQDSLDKALMAKEASLFSRMKKRYIIWRRDAKQYSAEKHKAAEKLKEEAEDRKRQSE
jgi:hypothetical protein